MATKEEIWSVGTLMKASMYAAVNFAVFRAVGWVGPLRVGPFFVILLLTILNLLFFWFSRYHRDRAHRRFWDWFEFVGWGMIGLTVTFAEGLSVLLVRPMDWLADREWLRRDGTAPLLLYLLGATVLYGLFPLAVASFAAWMSTRRGGMSVRRSHEAEGDRLEGSRP